MGIFARITATDNTKIGVHRFGAAVRLWAGGGLTRQNVIDSFALTGDEVTELDALKASYDALAINNISNAIIKVARLDRMEDVFLLCETGDLNETQAKNLLGF